ncbi:BA75_02774T0 [Komagataella pastoris]|uniref:BA75_02774T0 n=1 Tax=Komagataella pastoris TaxID=4922 RepID=A0A1B2JCP3_PICPA|nr:BA75_02774T0 [Komagataella pastoris]
MEKYQDKYHPKFVPGTYSIRAVKNSKLWGGNGDIKEWKMRNGMILLPQPSNSVNDPLNWGFLRKSVHFIQLVILAGFTAAISNNASAVQTDIHDEFNISYDAMNTGAGVLFIAIALSCFLLGPICRVYGRKIVYLIGLVFAVLGCIWFTELRNRADAICSQIFIGISQGSTSAQVQHSFSDIFFNHQLGASITIYVLSYCIGTYLGPLITRYITTSQGWHWVGWYGAIIAGILLVVCALFLEDTSFDRSLYDPLLDGETQKNFYETKLSRLNSRGQQKLQQIRELQNMLRNSLNVTSTDEDNDSINLRPYNLYYPNGQGDEEGPKSYYQRTKLLRTTPKFGDLSKLSSLLVHSLKVFSFPSVWLSGAFFGFQLSALSFYLTTEDTDYAEPPFSYSDSEIARMNIPPLIGSIIGCLYAGSALDYFVLWLSRKNDDKREAEFRLWFALLNAIISPAGLLMFGIGTARNLDWRIAYVGLGFIGFGFSVGSDLAFTYVMECYPEMILECMTGVATIANLLGCIFTFACSPWLEASGVENTYIALAVINIVLMLGSLPFIRWGKHFRARTREGYLNFVENIEN